MHMARLFDTSRKRYSLEELVKDYLSESDLEKRNMAERFGRKRLLKSGGESKQVVIPDTVELQQDPEYRNDWIDYSTMDAELTFKLFLYLSKQLTCQAIDGSNCDKEFLKHYQNLANVYFEWMVPFGEMLTDMERYGFKVDVEQLKIADEAAERDRIALEDSFRSWAESKSPDARYMNVHSDKQKQQLLFAPCKNSKNKSLEMELEHTFEVEQTGIQAERLLREEEAARKENPELLKDEKKRRSKRLLKSVTLKGLGKKPSQFSPSGWPSVAAPCLQKLAGNPRANPPVYGDPSDEEMCRALADIVEASTVATLQSSFIKPLQSWPGADGRIHASLNLNTETGRLSSRRPNLQNQPALDKDRYKIRKAFICEPGNRLIVADYGQLELRLMAHITNCKSMLDAFRSGGDFHSRTAVTMFDHVAEAVNSGKVLLERKHGEDASVPLVKEKFAAERRKAKTLNFSIAYGKTVYGLAKDWDVGVGEARKTLDLWYKERQEVLEWQKQCRKKAKQLGYVETIFGRRRHMPHANSKIKQFREQAARAAINAPLQGSAADLVMAAMLKLHSNRVLNSLGWRIILQVHDEVVLEGPVESADIALGIVKEDMKHPVDFPLLVDLSVDASIATSWLEAK